MMSFVRSGLRRLYARRDRHRLNLRSFGSREALRQHLGPGISAHGWMIGEWSYGYPEVAGAGEAPLTIGRYTSIAQGCRILLGHEHNSHWISTFPFPAAPDIFPSSVGISGHPFSRGAVKIGNDVWIGEDVTILSGAQIGDGVIIGAKSLVRGTHPPYSIIGGVPARMIRFRFNFQQIEQLLRIRWWDWDDHAVSRIIPDLCSSRIDEFLEQYRKRPGDQD